MPLCREQEHSFTRAIRIQMFSFKLQVLFYTSSASLHRPTLIWPRHIIHHRASIGACFFPTYTWSLQDLTYSLSVVHLQHSDLHPNDSLCTTPPPPPPPHPPLSPCIALSSDSTEHHLQAHFSPNSADNEGEALQSYRSSLSAPHKEFFSRSM